MFSEGPGCWRSHGKKIKTKHTKVHCVIFQKVQLANERTVLRIVFFFLSISSTESSHVCTPQGEALSVKPLCRSTPRVTFKICMCHPLAPQAMNQCRLCKKKKKSSCIESSCHLGHSIKSWRGETLRLKGNIFPLKWNNCDMGFAFFFSPPSFEEKQCSSCCDEFILRSERKPVSREEAGPESGG